MADYSNPGWWYDNIKRLPPEEKGITYRWSNKVNPENGLYGNVAAGDDLPHAAGGPRARVCLYRDEVLARELMALTKVVDAIVDAFPVNAAAEEPTITEPPAIVAPDQRGVGLEHLVDHLRGRVAELVIEVERLQQERDEAVANYETLRDAIRSARDELDGF